MLKNNLRNMMKDGHLDETEIAVLVFIEPVCTDEPSTPTAFA